MQGRQLRCRQAMVLKQHARMQIDRSRDATQLNKDLVFESERTS